MNVVILSSCGPINTCLINSIGARHPIRHVFRIVWDAPRQGESRWSKLAKSPLTTMLRAIRNNFYKRYLARIEARAVNHFLMEGAPPTDASPCSSIDRLQVNSKEFASALRALEPDILIVSGCPLLKPEIFEMPRLGTINVHRGVAPAYRGERTIFWPLYYRDFDHIGVTLHFIDRGVDTGPVLAHGFPELLSGDDEAAILAKSIALASDLIDLALIAAKSGHLQGIRQIGEGRCYYAREQRIWKDLAYVTARALRLRSTPSRPQRIETYFDGRQRVPRLDGDKRCIAP